MKVKYWLFCLLFLTQSCALLLKPEELETEESGISGGSSNFSSGSKYSSSSTSSRNSNKAKTAKLDNLIKNLCEFKAPCQKSLLKNLVVTSPAFVSQYDKETKKPKIYAFYASDPKTQAGIKVVVSPNPRYFKSEDYFFAENKKDQKLPQIGDEISVIGQAVSFYKEPQFSKVSEIKKIKSHGGLENILEPVEINGELKKYVGQLVQLKNPEITQSCAPVKKTQDFGYFKVSGNIEVGNVFTKGFVGTWPENFKASQKSCKEQEKKSKCNDFRVQGHVFESLTGIVDLSFNVYRLQPRSLEDFEPNDFEKEDCLETAEAENGGED